jgi:predicted lipid-binding transport protein (Tim44 family)
MLALMKRCTPFLLIFLALILVDAGITADNAEARSKFGGRSFSSPARQAPKQAPSSLNQNTQRNQQPGGFGRGMMGGLLGGALGGLLLGSMFGMGGNGMGILPLLVLGGVGYFLYKRFVNRPTSPSASGYQPPPEANRFQNGANVFGSGSVPPVPPVPEQDATESGLAAIRQTDPGFDEKHFLEVASDVFFKVQAGWMRRDLSAFRHLLGAQLAGEYESHFADMKAKGHINKLESIAVRRLELVGAGSENGEDFVTVLFTANLLDYTVDDKTGDVVEGSMTEPVKFAEQWTWARPVRTEDWKLEGIEVVED